MFDDLAVFQFEDIHDGVATRAGRRHAVNMLDHESLSAKTRMTSLCGSGNLSRRKVPNRIRVLAKSQHHLTFYASLSEHKVYSVY